jgi:Putative prokaryotic signal transducing protein
VTDDVVRLTVVANELEAEMIRSLLSTAGIESIQRYTDFGAGALDGMPSGGGPREILVHAGDLDAARELIGPE